MSQVDSRLVISFIQQEPMNVAVFGDLGEMTDTTIDHVSVWALADVIEILHSSVVPFSVEGAILTIDSTAPGHL